MMHLTGIFIFAAKSDNLVANVNPIIILKIIKSDLFYA